MSKNKKLFMIGFVSLAIIGLYNLIIFLCFKEYSANFWISYGFITTFIVLTAISVIIFTIGKFAGKIVDISVPSLSALALMINLVMGTIFMFFPAINFNFVFLPQIILLVLLLISYVPAMMSKNVVGAERKEKVDGKRTYQYEQREIDDSNEN